MIRYERRPGRRLQRRTFVTLFGLTALALALSLLTPLRALQTGVLRWGDTALAAPTLGTTLVIAGNATLPSGLNGGLSVIAGNADVRGAVHGDVVTVFGSITLEPGAVVDGDVVAAGGRVHHSSDEQVKGDIIGNAPILAQPPRSLAARIRLAIAAWIGLLLLGVTLSALFPWPMLLVAATARRFTWQSLCTALGAGIALLLVIVPLALSVAGLPIAVALLLATLLAWAFGLVAIGVALGRRLLRPLGLTRSTLLASVVGLGVMGIIAAVPIVGPMLLCASGLWGAGAAVISALDSEAAETALFPKR